MKEILFFCNTLGCGGVENMLVTTLNALADDYNITLLLHYNSGVLDASVDKKVKVKYLGSPKSWKYIYKLMNIAPGFTRKLIGLKKQYDVEILYRYDLIGEYSKIMNGKRNITVVHGDMHCQEDAKEYLTTAEGKVFFGRVKAMLHKVDIIVCVSRNSQEGFLEAYGDKFATKTDVLPNAININNLISMSKAGIAAAGGGTQLSPGGGIKLVTVSRLDKKKNVIDILTAKKILDGRGYDTSLTVVGDGAELRPLLDYLAANDVAKVNFVGYQNNPYPYITVADIYVSASIEEAFGITYLEAMVLGKKVISYRNRGIEYLSAPEVDAVDFSPIALATAIERYINNPNFDVDSVNNFTRMFDVSIYKQKIVSIIEE